MNKNKIFGYTFLIFGIYLMSGLLVYLGFGIFALTAGSFSLLSQLVFNLIMPILLVVSGINLIKNRVKKILIVITLVIIVMWIGIWMFESHIVIPAKMTYRQVHSIPLGLTGGINEPYVEFDDYFGQVTAPPDHLFITRVMFATFLGIGRHPVLSE